MVPLSPTQAYGVASQFIVDGSCPSSNPKLNAVMAYPPALNITNPGYPAAPVNAGDKLMLAAAKSTGAKNAAFLYGFNTTIVALGSDGSATIPSDLTGQSYVVLTDAVEGEVLTNAK